ncbi:MAG TPA: CoA transferase [Candidatus Binataceae bacterium]|nr:CoA transferase [Candidatus Binataceae bacterium]
MADLPLSGIRVLDFTWAWAGPFCTMQLAHLGAEVIRIETTARPPCVTRAVPPFADDIPGPNRAGYFNQYNQGKRAMTLNLARPEATDIICAMLKHFDIVADNFAAGIMDKLGLGYEKLRGIKPDIIMIQMSGYGQTGPFKGFVGYGPPASAASGIFHGTGYPGGEPMEVGISYPDPNAGIFGAFAVMAALTHRALTGEGQYIDQSQWETALVLMPEGMLEQEFNHREPVRKGNRDTLMAPHNCYKAAGDDETWVAIAVGNEDEWRAFCQAIGQPGIATDPRFATAALRKQNEDALDAIITGWTKERDRWEVAKLLQSAGVAAFPSMGNKDLAEDPHLRERGFLVELEHPEVGKRIHAGIPWRMSGTPCAVKSPAPLRGADTEYVLKTFLGYTSDRIEQLRKAEILI